MSNDKGKFSAEISQSVIDEALGSVRRRTAADASEPTGADSPAEGVHVSTDAEAEAGAPSVHAAELASLQALLELSQAKSRELMEKLREEHERALRSAADLENYRKRALKEKEEMQKFGIERLLKDFLPVADNFDRALDHAQKTPDLASLQKGVEMTRRLFDSAMTKHGLKSFSALGQLFDPRLHEAMSQVETTDSPPNTVVFEMSRGYLLHDRLVRPAMVSVAKAPVPNPEARGETSSDAPESDHG